VPLGNDARRTSAMSSSIEEEMDEEGSPQVPQNALLKKIYSMFTKIMLI
jgi:hypothetical protein